MELYKSVAMLSVTNKPFMLSVVMLNVMAPNYTLWQIMLRNPRKLLCLKQIFFYFSGAVFIKLFYYHCHSGQIS
jgi:hypothetical protein